MVESHSMILFLNVSVKFYCLLIQGHEEWAAVFRTAPLLCLLPRQEMARSIRLREHKQLM